ncbi:ATP:guanido phosphotransferase [compost metagenome]
MDSKEAAQRVSDIRLGSDLGILSEVTPQMLNELMVMTQPGFLQQAFQEKLSPEQRDFRRAELIRKQLRKEIDHGGAGI